MGSLLNDMDAALDRVGSRELYVEIARLFADAIPQTEVAITSAMARQDWTEARRLVHSMKGNCATIGAEELRGRIYILEKTCADADAETAVRLFVSLREELLALREELLAL